MENVSWGWGFSRMVRGSSGGNTGSLRPCSPVSQLLHVRGPAEESRGWLTRWPGVKCAVARAQQMNLEERTECLYRWPECIEGSCKALEVCYPASFPWATLITSTLQTRGLRLGQFIRLHSQ